MNDNLFHRLVRRLGIVGLAVVLIAAAVGFFYVARLTQTVSTQTGSPTTPFGLFVLAGGAAIAGLGTLRFAIGHSDDEAR